MIRSACLHGFATMQHIGLLSIMYLVTGYEHLKLKIERDDGNQHYFDDIVFRLLYVIILTIKIDYRIFYRLFELNKTK